MKNWFIAMVFILVSPVLALAQNQQAATRIADAAQPTDLLVDVMVNCMERMEKLDVSENKAFDACMKAMEREAKRSEKVANEAADATQKNRWPQPPTFGGAYGAIYTGTGYHSTAGVVNGSGSSVWTIWPEHNGRRR